jgi:hypothetical protein
MAARRREPHQVPNWLFDLQAWSLAVYSSAFFVVVTWLGIIFVRPFLRLWLRNQEHRNDLIDHVSAGFSLFYGLLLGLLSVATFQNVEEVESAVLRETAGIARLYRDMAGYPEPHRSELQYLLRDYTLHVIHKDWPAHQRGAITLGGGARMTTIQQRLLSFEPETKAQGILLTETFGDLKDVGTARLERVSGVLLGIPGVLWYVVIVGAAINIVLIWMLDMRITVHMILGGLISFFLGVMIFLIVAMDRPFRGDVSVSSRPYEILYEKVMRWDETT